MKKILLVDDYKLSRELMQKLLQDKGYIVDIAKDGIETINLARLNKYDLVLVDMIIKDTDTKELIKELLNNHAKEEIAILYTTGTEELLDQYKNFGISQFVLKSTTNQDALINSILAICPI